MPENNNRDVPIPLAVATLLIVLVLLFVGPMGFPVYFENVYYYISSKPNLLSCLLFTLFINIACICTISSRLIKLNQQGNRIRNLKNKFMFNGKAFLMSALKVSIFVIIAITLFEYFVDIEDFIQKGLVNKELAENFKIFMMINILSSSLFLLTRIYNILKSNLLTKLVNPDKLPAFPKTVDSIVLGSIGEASA